MTRAEAIEILRKNRPTSDPRPCGKELCDAVDRAISALRQQETVENHNEPLTLDELRSSVKFGYSVYLVGMEDGDGFVFIHHVDFCSVRYSRIDDHPEVEYCFRTKSYGVRVWAYLQTQEEVGHD